MKVLLAALILCDARWVIRYTFGVSARFPLFPQKPTFTCTAPSVAMGHSRLCKHGGIRGRRNAPNPHQ